MSWLETFGKLAEERLVWCSSALLLANGRIGDMAMLPGLGLSFLKVLLKGLKRRMFYLC
jgi:hypothetical protein